MSINLTDQTKELPGEYTCEAQRADIGDFDELAYTFDVQYKPVVSLDPSEAIVKKESESFSINCIIDANPTATIQWSRDGQVLKDQLSAILTFANVTYKEHGGTYECKAENAHGSTVISTPVTVVVMPVATIKVDGAVAKTLNVTENGSMTLNCNAEGQPKPTIFKWTLPNATIIEADTYQKGIFLTCYLNK